MAYNYQVVKEKTIQLRKDVAEVVAEHGPITAHQIARLLKVSNMCISSTFIGLVNAGYLEHGPMAPSESKNRHLVNTFLRGPNLNPVPSEYRLIKKTYYIPRAKRDPNEAVIPSPKKEMITDEDLAWMKKYKLQRQQRYARFGEVAPAVN